MLKKFILSALLILIGVGVGFTIARLQNPLFKTLSAQEAHARIIEQRDFAIQKAIEAGSYKCCINPPCTMCYMEANQWNNFQAGTCACDDLIAEGSEPCPQCVTGLCESETEGTCQVEDF